MNPYGISRRPIFRSAKQKALTKRRELLGHVVRMSDGTTRIEGIGGQRPQQITGR